MLFNKKIDMIIPVYNATYEQMFNCLSSLATQSIKDDIKITIVDDASTSQEYLEAISKFENYLEIDLIVLEQNVGPGGARQYGIDHTENEYIAFSDSDDVWSNGFALQLLRDGLNTDPLNSICVGEFQEIHYDNDDKLIILTHKEDSVWVFGKIYKREFLSRHNIRFHPTSRANEDSGFNTLCKMYTSDTEKIMYIPENVYYWCYNPNSIVRKDQCKYATSGEKDDSFYGYIENMSYVITRALDDATIKNKNGIYDQIVISMVNIYCFYLAILDNKNEQDIQEGLKYAKQFYSKIYCSLKEENMPEDRFKQIYSEIMSSQYTGKKLHKIIPDIGFYDFLKLLQD